MPFAGSGRDLQRPPAAWAGYSDLLDVAPFMAWRATPDGARTWFNRSWLAFGGRSLTEEAGFGWISRINRDDVGGYLAAYVDACREGRAFTTEYRCLRQDGAYRRVRETAVPFRDEAGGLVGFGVELGEDPARDTRLAEALAERRALLLELNDRVKNMLSVVQSLAHFAFKEDRSRGDVLHAFKERLFVLAKAHDLLAERHWAGVSLDAVVSAATTRLVAGKSAQVTISGAPVELPPRGVVPLALILHELSLEAKRRDVLGGDQGRLAISWARIEEERQQALRFEWCESGYGRPAKPGFSGVSMRIVERGLAAHRGQVSLSFPADGLACSIMLPLGRADRTAISEAALDGVTDKAVR